MRWRDRKKYMMLTYRRFRQITDPVFVCPQGRLFVGADLAVRVAPPGDVLLRSLHGLPAFRNEMRLREEKEPES